MLVIGNIPAELVLQVPVDLYLGVAGTFKEFEPLIVYLGARHLKTKPLVMFN